MNTMSGTSAQRHTGDSKTELLLNWTQQFDSTLSDRSFIKCNPSQSSSDSELIRFGPYQCHYIF